MDDSSPTSLHDRRLVRDTLRPLAERIGKQQITVANVTALQKLGRSRLGDSVTKLINDLDAIEHDFERAIFSLPARLRADSRVTDVRKSLLQLRVSVEALLLGN